MATKSERPEAAESKAAFLANIRIERDEPIEVEGAKVQALGDAGYCRVKALRDNEAMKHKGDERLTAYSQAERAAYLTVGVVEPAMPFPEWMHILKTANTGKIETIIETIKRISGIEDIEVALAKKALEQIQSPTAS